MDIILEKNGEKRVVKSGSALYTLWSLIPFGGIATIVISIQRKQFKAVFLNSLILSIIFSIVSGVALGVALGLQSGLLAILLGIIDIAFMVFVIYYFINLVINLNRYSLSNYIAKDYEIVNEDMLDEKTKVWIEVNKDKKIPKYFILDI